MPLIHLFVLSFSHEMSWMRSGTQLSQFLRVSYLLLQQHKYGSHKTTTALPNINHYRNIA